MMAAYVGMTITLYPILKRHNESLALGYVGFRLVAAAFIVIGVILLLLLLTLSQEFVKAACRFHPISKPSAKSCEPGAIWSTMWA